MAESTPTTVFSAAAKTAVQTQKFFDHAFDEQQPMPGITRQAVASMSIETLVEVVENRRHGVSLALQPLGLGAFVRRGLTTSSQSRLSIEITQVPVPATLADDQQKE